MALVSLNVATITRSGLDLGTVGSAPVQCQTVNAADTAEFVNDGKTFLLVIQGGVSGNLTIVTPLTLGNVPVAVADQVKAITNGQAWWLGPFDPNLYNSGGKVTIDPDQTCQVAAYRMEG